MDLDINVDVARIDAELLQIPELSPLAVKAKPFVAEKLFDQWLSLPETNSLVKSLLNNAKGAGVLNVSGISSSTNANASNSLPSMFPVGSTPPLSPRSSSGSPRITKFRAGPGPSSLGSPLKFVSEPVKELIPQFYFLNGHPPPNELKERCLFRINQFFYGHGDGLQMHEFELVTKEIFQLPSFFSSALFRKIDVEGTGTVTRFKCIDLDCNGIITRNEMQFFYEEQLHRMECMAQEPVVFEDILCQIVDMINPKDESYFTLCDLKRSKLSGSVFNILFNLNKFMAFETRDPFLIPQEREKPNLTEWYRFAHREYIRLSMEEDAEDASNGSADVWDESLEAPF